MTQYMAPIAVIGAGEVLLLDLAEIDLSAGQVFLTAPWFVVIMGQHGVPLGWGIGLSLLICCLIGAFNGSIVVWLKVPSFVATLGVNYVLAGWVLVASSDITTDMPGTTGKFGAWSWASATGPRVCGAWGSSSSSGRCSRGRYSACTRRRRVATSSAPPRPACVPGRIKIWCFVIIAFISAFIGIIDSIRIGSLDPAAPGLNEMLAGVTAAVIGGTALTGGKATVVGTLIGAIVLGVLEDGFNLIGISANWFILVEGAVILAAMAVNVQLGRVTAKTMRR